MRKRRFHIIIREERIKDKMFNSNNDKYRSKTYIR